MATPTFSSVTPARGHSGGGTVLRIVGTGFKLPADPPATGPVPEAPATVRVFLGGVEARRVQVASATVLYVTTERCSPGAVALEIRNVGPYGETLGDELVVASAVYEYARPTFTTKSDLERLVKVLHAELVRQVYTQVVVSAHVDWTENPTEAIRGSSEAPLPCVFLAGPTLRPNPVYRTNERALVAIDGVDDVFREHRAPRTDDVVFTLGALAEKYATILSLSSALRDFALRNPFLYFPREEGSAELVRYDLTFSGDFGIDSSPDASNVRSCSGTVSIDGFDFLTAPGFESDQAIGAHSTLLDPPTVTTGGVP